MQRRLFTLAAAAAACAALPCLAQGGLPAVPADIYVPPGATLVKIKQEADGDFSVKYHLPKGDIHALAQQARAHAEQKGWRTIKNHDKGDEVEVELARGNAELEISVEREWNGIEYEAEIDRHERRRRPPQ